MKRKQTIILALVAVVGLLVMTVHASVSQDKKPTSYGRMIVYFLTFDLGEIKLEEHIQAKHERFLNQVVMSDAVVTRLIDAEISLSAAIEELDNINVDREAFDPNVFNNLTKNHADTRCEVIARYAIGKAETLLEIHNPSKMDNVLARLRMEFAAIFGCKA
jgi:hypothetical protein